MESTSSETVPPDDNDTEESVESETPETDHSEPAPSAPLNHGSTETKWQIVAKAPGLTPAQIIANGLIAEGIPARAWQEGAGVALGLTVGLLGTGYVAVPAKYEKEAKSILAMFEEDDQNEFYDIDDDE